MTNMSPRSTTGLSCKSRQTDINYKVCAVVFCNGATVSLNIQKESTNGTLTLNQSCVASTEYMYTECSIVYSTDSIVY
jgi:hypothetical protein